MFIISSDIMNSFGAVVPLREMIERIEALNGERHTREQYSFFYTVIANCGTLLTLPVGDGGQKKSKNFTFPKTVKTVQTKCRIEGRGK